MFRGHLPNSGGEESDILLSLHGFPASEVSPEIKNTLAQLMSISKRADYSLTQVYILSNAISHLTANSFQKKNS